MPKTLSLIFSKAGFPHQFAEWDNWFDTQHLPDLVNTGLFQAASRWQTIYPNKALYGPTLGFNEVCLGDGEATDAEAQHRRVTETLSQWRTTGRLSLYHFIDEVMTFQPTGRWTSRIASSSATKGHFIVFNRSNDPGKLAEWNEWLDNTHLPEVLETGKFHGVTRWSRVNPTLFGPNFLVLFDIRDDDITAGITLVIESNKAWERTGNIPVFHAGALMLLTKPAGKHGAAGVRRTG